MSLRILILSRYDKLGSSSRLRMLQYIPRLEALGAQVSVAPLLDDAYILSLYNSQGGLLSKARNLAATAMSYWQRLWIIAGSKKFDVLWLEKELFPFLPGLFELLPGAMGLPYVVDYDDATFHRYDLHDSKIVRLLLGGKLKPLLASADAVTAGNRYLADYASRAGAKQVSIVPTVLDIDRYSVSPEPADEVFRIGWIGSPSTAKYLNVIAEPLRKLAQQKRIILVTIGASALELPGVSLEQHEWTLATEAKLLESIHVGVMPLPDSPWERGKCGYKLIQYMACGRPVIASPVGVNTEIVTAEVGFLAADEQAWLDAFNTLIDQATLRQKLGRSGRMRVEQEFSLQAAAAKIARILADAAGRDY